MKRLLLCSLVIMAVIISTIGSAFAYSINKSSEYLTKEQALQLWKSEKSKIDEIDSAISALSISKNNNRSLLSPDVNYQTLKKNGVKEFKTNKDNKNEFKNSMKSMNINIGDIEIPESSNVYIYDFVYYAAVESSKDNIPGAVSPQSTESNYVYQGHPMRLIWVNAMDTSTYYFQSSHESLDKVGEYVRNVANNCINVLIGNAVPGYLDTALSLFGINYTDILATQKVVTYGDTYYFAGSGSYTKMFVQVLDTNNYYGGGYVPCAATNKLDTDWNITFCFFNTAIQRADSKNTNVKKTFYSNSYMNNIYSYAWDNYQYRNGYYTYYMGDVQLQTLSGTRNYMYRQNYDIFDQVYGK